MVNCCIEDLFRKDVINIADGCRVGCVYDVEIDTSNGCLVALVVLRQERFSPFHKPHKEKVCWKDIVVIGDETVLVKNVIACPCEKNTGKHIIDNFLNK